jgi:hypothetical protein
MSLTLIVNKIVPIDDIHAGECRFDKLQVARGCPQHHGYMIKVRISNQALELTGELWRFKQD